MQTFLHLFHDCMDTFISFTYFIVAGIASMQVTHIEAAACMPDLSYQLTKVHKWLLYHGHVQKNI